MLRSRNAQKSWLTLLPVTLLIFIPLVTSACEPASTAAPLPKSMNDDKLPETPYRVSGLTAPGEPGGKGTTSIPKPTITPLASPLLASPVQGLMPKSKGGVGPAIIRSVGQAESSGNAAELSSVQLAMDTMMTQNGILTVEKSPAEGTNVFDTSPASDGGEPLYPNYLRQLGTHGNPTKCTYTWTAAGEVSQLSCP